MKGQKFTPLNTTKKTKTTLYFFIFLLGLIIVSIVYITTKEIKKTKKTPKIEISPKIEKTEKTEKIPKIPIFEKTEKIGKSHKSQITPDLKLQKIYKNYKKYENRIITDSRKNKYKIKKIYLREDLTYTQGLFFLNNKLYESGGLYKKSSFLSREKKNFAFKKLKKEKMEKKYFAEGADFYKKNGKTYFYQLTWQNRKIIKRDKNLKILKKIKLPSKIKEGWGITHNPKKPNIFFISDGTNKIFECNCEKNFKILKTHKIFFNQKKVDFINELEFFNNKLYANIYPTNYIVSINLNNDKLDKIFVFDELENIGNKIMMDMRGRRFRDKDEVFNGIAFNWETKELVVTGKNWPVFFGIEIL